MHNSSSNNKKQIVVIGYDSTGEDQFFTNELAFIKWCQNELDARMIADVSPVLLQEKPSAMPNLSAVIRKIKQEWKRADGIACILPPEQFLCVASRVAFEIGTMGKPIVLATAFGHDPESKKSFYTHPSLPLHVMNAVQVGTVDLSGVLVVGGSEIFPATHAVAIGRDQHIVSADRLVYGHVDFGVRTTHAAVSGSDAGIVPRTSDGSVAFVDASIEQFAEVILHAAQKSIGIVVCNGSPTLRQLIDSESPKTLPVLLCDPDRVQIREKGSWSVVEHLTPDCAAAKFAWILEHRKTEPAVKRGSIAANMQIDLIGETLL